MTRLQVGPEVLDWVQVGTAGWPRHRHYSKALHYYISFVTCGFALLEDYTWVFVYEGEDFVFLYIDVTPCINTSWNSMQL